jgi:nitroreductase
MDAYKAAITKRDRRDFDQRPVPDDVLHRILQSGRMAGSGGNRQPWRFVVVTDRAKLDRLGETGKGGNTAKAAPMAVILLMEQIPGRDADQRIRDGFDIGRAGENMMLAAWSDGVLSCPLGLSDHAVCRQVLGYPDNYEVAVGLAFGYPAPAEAEGRPRESRKRIPLEELTHFERWGNQKTSV